MAEKVTFWFDALCPFAWQTSRFVKEVEKVRDVEVDWVPMSLAILNENNDDAPEDYKKSVARAWGPARVFAAVKTEKPEKVDELYTEVGTALHKNDEKNTDQSERFTDLLRRSLKAVGLDEAYADVAETTEWDDKLREYHNGAIDLVGDDVGTPTIALNGVGFFGPVITRVPTGEEAGEIFDAAVRLANYPYFFELKRTRTESPQVS
ncbi:DsbA family protein [Corynebacterium otitidis]|uniref:mycothiol-dependent nitroreductase Rv2466c family protein n=1 Tax=Corynebacterium otitidis TaxID=29321 RepID=UPI000627AAA2|nr:DsbA family protein [Corynebacterium otitidis]KKO83235.1 DSBA oxidoreductase [Corynebacterium otitidis]